MSVSTAERIFSDQELDHLATPLSIHVERAAKARDLADVPWIVDQMNQECLGIYDAYVSWMGVLQTFIVERAGEGAHDLALTWVAEYGTRPFVRAYAGLDARERALKLAERLRASGSTFDVLEDERRIRFRVDPWGPVRWWREGNTAGQSWEDPGAARADRLRYPCYGHYGPPVSFAILTGERPLTHGRASLPSFLATEILFLETAPIELFGYPIAAIELGERADDPTFLDVYKDPSDVPAEVYARAGTTKPVGGLPTGTRERLLSDEELNRMGTPLSLQVQQAAAADDYARLLAISAGMDVELVGAKDPIGVSIAGLLSWIAWHFGEQAAEEALARTAEVVMAPFLSAVRDLTIKDAIPAWCVAWRSHGSTFWMEERDETVILRGRPLGACHRMLSHAYQPNVQRISESRVRYPTFGCYDAPASMHLMREPRGITHGKVRYPIYSCHCHMLHEIYPIDQIGHPLWVEEHNIDDWDGEMIHTHYKDASAWPARYYEQVGRSK
jgi:hypothetical protein